MSIGPVPGTVLRVTVNYLVCIHSSSGPRRKQGIGRFGGPPEGTPGEVMEQKCRPRHRDLCCHQERPESGLASREQPELRAVRAVGRGRRGCVRFSRGEAGAQAMLSREIRGHRSQHKPRSRAKGQATALVGEVLSVIPHVFAVPGAGDAAVNETDIAPGPLELVSL